MCIRDSTHHHVVQQGTGQAMQGTVFLFIVGAGHVDDVALLGQGHLLAELLGQGTLGALDGDQIAFAQGHFHIVG